MMSLILNHILFFVTLIVLPTYVFFNTNKIKASLDPSIKEKTYVKIFVFYWTITVAFLMLSPIKNIFYFRDTINLNSIWIGVTVVIGIYLFFGHVIPVLLLTFSDKLREMTTASFDNKSYIYPTTDHQRRLFIIVPITVGICEEIIFRGYLFRYFQSTPFTLSATLSFLLVTLIFGLEHFQQGVSGVVETIILGYLLGILYIVTGNLLLPIIIHVLFDAKILYISWTLNKYKMQHIDKPIN